MFEIPTIIDFFQQLYSFLFSERVNVAVFHLPSAFAPYRLLHFAQWLKTHHNLTFTFINLDTYTPDYPPILPSNPDPIVVYPATLLPNYPQLLNQLYFKAFTHTNPTLLSFPSPPSLIVKHSSWFNYTPFFQNSLFYPLYNQTDSQAFINYLTRQWQIKLPSTFVKLIYPETGGYLWLIKEIIRLYKRNPKLSFTQIINQPSYQFKTQTIYNSLPSSIKQLLKPDSKAPTTSLTQDLIRLNLLNHKLQPLPQFLVRLAFAPINIVIKPTQIIINHTDYSYNFSPRELKLLYALYSSPLLNREHIAQILWGNKADELYSDWAIDQAISRLRTKLAKLNLPISIITIKKHGYQLCNLTLSSI